MREYFCGWYFKCQSDSQALAIIPAVHTSKTQRSCSIQLITDNTAFNCCLPYEEFEQHKRKFDIRIGDNHFSEKGIRLQLQTPETSAEGVIRFGALSPIRYDIMGPFRYVPFMECRHSIVSMRHTVDGEMRINDTTFRFKDATGYIEGDRGYSFPTAYAWTQCCFDGGSLMLSVAHIPLRPFHFTGVIGVIHWQGKEYRLATYLGAKAVKIEKGELVIQQGDIVFSATLLKKHAHPLRAPTSGMMSRTIHESVACHAAYCLRKNGQTIFSFETPKASFEYEYPY